MGEILDREYKWSISQKIAQFLLTSHLNFKLLNFCSILEELAAFEGSWNKTLRFENHFIWLNHIISKLVTLESGQLNK